MWGIFWVFFSPAAPEVVIEGPAHLARRVSRPASWPSGGLAAFVGGES